MTRVVPDVRLEREAEETTRKLAAGPTVCLGEMRGLVRDSLSRTLSEGLLAEQDAMARTGATADAPRAIGAFGTREVPTFAGS